MTAKPTKSLLFRTDEREYYGGFTLNGSTFAVGDTVFLNSGHQEAKLTVKQTLDSWYIAAIDCVFRDIGSKEVFLGVRWFYRSADIPDEIELPKDFEKKADELAFSDHYDENPASTVEQHCHVRLCVDTASDKPPMLPRDGKKFVCRLMHLLKANRTIDLARALAVDGDTPKRSLVLLRQMLRRQQRDSLPSKYRDPCDADEWHYVCVGTMDGGKAPGGAAARSSSSSKARKRSAAIESGVNSAASTPRKKSRKGAGKAEANSDSASDAAADAHEVMRFPTMAEASKLLLTRGELAVLSGTRSAFERVIGGLVLLKQKAEVQPRTTLLEIRELPEMEAPYRPYHVSYVTPDGEQKFIDDCVAGLELLLHDGELSRRSLVNVRDRLLDEHEYDTWRRTKIAGSLYPAKESEIAKAVERIEELRRKFLDGKVRPPEHHPRMRRLAADEVSPNNGKA